MSASKSAPSSERSPDSRKPFQVTDDDPFARETLMPEAVETTPEDIAITPTTGEYGAEQLKHLSDLEHVRARPAMYIGDITDRGLHHLVYEVVDNSIDEAMAGHAKNVRVMVNGD